MSTSISSPFHSHKKTSLSAQNLKCQPRTEICRRNSSCSPANSTSCYSCVRKSVLSTPTSYDDYYEYDDDDDDAQQLEEKLDLNEYQDYADDYAEPFDRSKPVRKLGACPPPLADVPPCNRSQSVQPTCRLDSDCPGDLKCCAAACEKRTCTKPVQGELCTSLVFLFDVVFFSSVDKLSSDVSVLVELSARLSRRRERLSALRMPIVSVDGAMHQGVSSGLFERSVQL